MSMTAVDQLVPNVSIQVFVPSPQLEWNHNRIDIRTTRIGIKKKNGYRGDTKYPNNFRESNKQTKIIEKIPQSDMLLSCLVWQESS